MDGCIGFKRSKSLIEAATIQAIILSGRYRDDYLTAKFSRQNQGHCLMCGYYPGNVSHYLSGACPTLATQLQSCLDRCFQFLSLTPYLLPPVYSALNNDADDWVGLVVDPSTNKEVIKIRQYFGDQSIWPLFRLSRAYIWCMHCERRKFMDTLT